MLYIKVLGRSSDRRLVVIVSELKMIMGRVVFNFGNCVWDFKDEFVCYYFSKCVMKYC